MTTSRAFVWLFASISVIVTVAWFVLILTDSDRTPGVTALMTTVIGGCSGLAVKAHHPE